MTDLKKQLNKKLGQHFDVSILVAKKVVSVINVRATDKEEAEELAKDMITVKITKAYGS